MARTGKILGEACAALAANKLRSFLMMLGIIIGIGALTAVICIGQGTREEILGRVAKHGPDMIMVRPGGEKQVFMAETDRPKASLAPEDADAIEASFPGVLRVAKVQNERGWDVVYGDTSIKQRIFAVSPVWAMIRRRKGLSHGESISEEDALHASRVCVLGSITWKTLFGDADPVGETVRIGNDPFKVKGVFHEVGAAAGKDDWDYRVIVPVTTATKRMFGRTYLEQIVVQVRDATTVPETAEGLREFLRERHGIKPGGLDDFFVREPKHIKEVALSTSTTLTTLLLAVSGIALLVGGVVIMNIMLLSVSQRTHEIGLRRALGARRGDILGQFLAEALFLSLAGGLVGILSGIGVAVVFDSQSSVTWIPIATSVTSCTFVALVFGLYPARKAAGVDPAVALRGRRT